MSFTNNGWGNETTAPTYVSGEPRHLTKIPLFLMIGILIASLVLLVGSIKSDTIPFVGYLLTPFGSIAALAWATAEDSKLRLDVWYDRKIGIMLAIRALAAISFIVGMAHMWEVATIIARSAAGGIG